MALEKRKEDLQEETIRTSNRRKKTKRWCKGKVGVEHVTEIVLSHQYAGRIPHRGCEWYPMYTYRGSVRVTLNHRYSCLHSLRCVNCGKYIEWSLKDVTKCPDYKPLTEKETND